MEHVLVAFVVASHFVLATVAAQPADVVVTLEPFAAWSNVIVGDVVGFALSCAVIAVAGVVATVVSFVAALAMESAGVAEAAADTAQMIVDHGVPPQSVDVLDSGYRPFPLRHLHDLAILEQKIQRRVDS